MKIFISLSSIADNLGDNFNLSSNGGIISPSSATRAELLNGIQAEVDESASTITITSQLLNNIFETKSIDKTAENCIDLNLGVQALKLSDYQGKIVTPSTLEIE
jgi:hypothetical protein